MCHTLSEERLSDMRTGNGRILVVEDDPAIRRLVEWLLEDEGLAVDGATDGAAAIRYLTDHRPALLILDVMMPRVDGHQVARALRSLHGRDTPILLLTAAGDARGLARRIGADRYLAKPFELDQLIALVRGLLEPAQLTTLAGRADESYLDTAAGG
jgi:DNA-binding response OmpR family regulator